MFTDKGKLLCFFRNFFSVLLSSGISPCGWTNWAVMPPTLGAALLCSSRVGSDMWLLSRNSIVHQDWGRTLLPWLNHQYRLRLETQFSWDLETARSEPGAAGLQAAPLPQSYHASVILQLSIVHFYQEFYLRILLIAFWELHECFIHLRADAKRTPSYSSDLHLLIFQNRPDRGD